jgi:hypothetical protein
MIDLTPEDEALLARAREGLTPEPDDQARIKRRLLARIAAGTALATSSVSASAGAAAPTASATVLSFLAKVVAIVAVGGAVAAEGYVAVKTMSGPAEPTRAPAMESPVRQPVPAQVVPNPRLAPLASVPEPPQAVTHDRESVQPAVAPVPVRPVAPVARPTPANRDVSSLAPSTSSIAESQGKPTPTPLVPPAASAPEAAPALAPNAEAVSPPTPSVPSTLAAEAAILTRAGAAFKGGDLVLALDLLDQHAASFPSGELSQDRESERVLVLCALGRTNDAKAAASRFLASWPRSTYAPRVRESCAGR